MTDPLTGPTETTDGEPSPLYDAVVADIGVDPLQEAHAEAVARRYWPDTYALLVDVAADAYRTQVD